MYNSAVSTTLMWAVRIGVWLLLLTPFIISSSWFFPYITGKNFFFRIIAELTFGIWLALIVIDARFRPKNGIILWAVLAFIGVLILATLFGADPYISFWSNYERMEGLVTYLHLAALFLMASTVFRTVRDWRLTFHVSVAISIVIAFYGLFELLGIIAIPGSTAAESGLGIFSRLGNQIYLAAYLLFHFFVLAFLFFTTRVMWWRAVYIATIAFEFYIFLHTGTRGALIGLTLGIATIFFALFIFSLRDNKRMALISGGLILSGIAVIGLFITFRESEFVQKSQILRRFADINTTSATAQSRLMIWGIAKEAFLERPLLGWGPGNFIIPYAKYYNPNLYGNEPWFDRVHNMHFEWLVAGGILGFISYLGLILAMLGTLWQLWRKHILDGIVVATMAGFLIAYLGQNTFVFDTIITYLFFMLFLALAHSLATAQKENQTPSTRLHRNNILMLAPVFIVVGILVASTAHTKQIQVAGGIIDMLNSVSAGKTVINMTQQLDEMKEKNTFGTTEARERFVDFLFAAARPSTQISSSDLAFLLTHGIEEMKIEVDRNPSNIKNRIALGKLYQLRFAVTNSKADYDESVNIYEEAIAEAPHFPSTYIGLAEVYLTSGDTASAVSTMDTIFRQMTIPSQLFVHSLLLVDVITGDYDTGVEHIQQYLRLGNTSEHPGPAQFDNGRIPDIVGRMEATKTGDARSRERFLEALQPGFAWQNNESYLKILINIKMDLGKIHEARELAKLLAETNPQLVPEIEEFLRSIDAL